LPLTFTPPRAAPFFAPARRNGANFGAANKIEAVSPFGHDTGTAGEGVKAMLLRDVMTPNVVTVRPEATAREAAEKMRASGVGSLPVCAGNRVLGVVADREVERCVGGGESTGRAVTDLMTPDAVYCYSDQDVGEATRLMEQHGVHRLYVLGRDHGLVGVVTRADLERGQAPGRAGRL
jgi:CBS domain-containing protein